MDALGCKHMSLDQLIERQQCRRAGADVTGHGRDRELDALPGKLLALPVERLVIGVFADQDHGQQARSGEASRDHVEGRGWLRDLLAGTAAELLAYMLSDKQLPRHHIQRLGDILPELRQPGAAAGWAAARSRVHDPSTRQMVREVPTCGLASRKALNLDRRAIGLGLVFAHRRGQLLELEFQLIEQTLTALRARSIHRALHLRDHQLKMLDQRFRTRQPGACFDQRGLERIGVVGNRIHRHAPTGSQYRAIRSAIL